MSKKTPSTIIKNSETKMLEDLCKKMDILTNTTNMEIRNVGEKLNKKLDLLTEEFLTFNSEIKAIKNQYSLILEVLGENTVAVKNSVKFQSPKFAKMFPIDSVEELKALDDLIDDTNEKEFSATIRAIIGNRGIQKGLTDIVTPKVLDKFNINGVHNKMRLLNFTKFINVIFMGSYNETSSVQPFKEDLRAALKLAKNRHYKENAALKKKSNPDKELSDEENETPKENLSNADAFQKQVDSLLSKF